MELSNFIVHEEVLKIIDDETKLHSYMELYLSLINEQSIVAVVESERYKTIKKQTKVIAKHNIDVKTKIDALVGFNCIISEGEKCLLTQREMDFSLS